MTINQQLHQRAHALRPVRILNGEAVHYTATTFPAAPRSGCERLLRQAEVTGDLGKVGKPLADTWIDVLAENGDILQEFPSGPKSFGFIRRKTKAVREWPMGRNASLSGLPLGKD